MIIGHPGSWQQFQLRLDNKNLSVMEMKSKYLHEQYLFEAQMLNLQQMQQQNMFMNGSGGGGPSSSTPTYSTALQLTFNDTLAGVENDFGFNPTSISEWNGRFINGGFEALTINNSDPSAPIITLKGNDTNVGIDADVFQTKTTLLSLIDLYNNCINEILANCFENNSTIQNVILNNVTTIETAAFAGCSSLSSVSFSSLTTIPNGTTDQDGVFANCDLSGGDLGTMFPVLVTVGDFAFYRTNIPTISSSTITTIGFRTFDNSTSLTSINLTSPVAFGNGANGRSFALCAGLDSITLPSLCTFVGDTFIDVANGGTAIVNNANINDASMLYLKNNKGWSVNP